MASLRVERYEEASVKKLLVRGTVLERWRDCRGGSDSDLVRILSFTRSTGRGSNQLTNQVAHVG